MGPKCQGSHSTQGKHGIWFLLYRGREKSGKFAVTQIGKLRENTRKIQGISDKYFLFFSGILMNSVLFAKMDTSFQFKKTQQAKH